MGSVLYDFLFLSKMPSLGSLVSAVQPENIKTHSSKYPP